MPQDRNRNEGSESRPEQDSLKRREYRGPKGEIHHHTHTYMEQHSGSNRDKGNKRDDNNNRKTR